MELLARRAINCSCKSGEAESVLPPDDGSLQFRLRVVHNVLQNPPQRNWDGQKDKDAGYEPGFTVRPDLGGGGSDTNMRLDFCHRIPDNTLYSVQ